MNDRSVRTRTYNAALLSAILLSAVQAIAGETTARPDVAEILAEARAAVGIDALAQKGLAISLSGRGRVLGITCDFELVVDGAGRFRRSTNGALGQTFGFDGTDTWLVNFAGTPRMLELGDHEEALIEPWLISGWWLASGAPLDFEPAPINEEGAHSLIFRMRGGHVKGQVNIDRTTHLPRSAAYDAEQVRQFMQLLDFTRHEGVMVPSRVVIADQRGSTTTYTVDDVHGVAEDITPRVTPDLERPDDARFDPGAPAALEVTRAPSGHLMVKVAIDGTPVDGYFFFDTGAGVTCLSTPVAKELGLEPFGEVVAVGIGGFEKAHFYRSKSLQVGPLTVENPCYGGIDLSFIEQAMGIKVAGIIGFDAIARCVVEYDGDVNSIALHDPASYRLERGEWQPLILYGGHPHVQASFEEQSGIFKIDTGAAGTVSFHAPAVEQLHLLEGRQTRASTSGGVGGIVPMREGELDYFELGGRRFDSPTVEFATERTGAFGDPYTTGNLGGTFLRPFVMVLDYGRRRIALVAK